MVRNPAYLDYELLAGDCTNFASQCLYAGSSVMNYTPIYGWYYNSGNNKSASWTGVEYLYRFLLKNKGPGPFAEESSADALQPGDIVQLGTPDGKFYHSPVVVGNQDGQIFVAAHSYDAYMRPLDSYQYGKIRFLRILGVRKDV